MRYRENPPVEVIVNANNVINNERDDIENYLPEINRQSNPVLFQAEMRELDYEETQSERERNAQLNIDQIQREIELLDHQDSDKIEHYEFADDESRITLYPNLLKYIIKMSTKWQKTNELSTTECAVCLSRFANGKKVMELHCRPQIYHVFHQECIFDWLSKTRSCPICRKDFAEVLQELYELEEYNDRAWDSSEEQESSNNYFANSENKVSKYFLNQVIKELSYIDLYR